ncbi:MAG: sodium:solute symporter family transporter [Opitutaceae bacterium]
MLYLFATPLYWVCTHWPRRMRILTLGDYFEERFDSKRMGAVYSIIGSLAMMAFIGLGLSAMSKTIVAITPKAAAAYSEADRALYEAEYQREAATAQAVGGEISVLGYEELLERETLPALPAGTRSEADAARLSVLESMRPATLVSYVSRDVVIWVVCFVVLLYAVTGGLEAAFLTDMVQGMFIIVLSTLLLPFAWAKINATCGGESWADALRTIHQKLPDAFFQVFGAPQTPDFTWYYIITLSIMAAVTVVVQPNGAVLAGSARDELSSRAGTVMGNFIKRFCIDPARSEAGARSLLCEDADAGDRRSRARCRGRARGAGVAGKHASLARLSEHPTRDLSLEPRGLGRIYPLRRRCGACAVVCLRAAGGRRVGESKVDGRRGRMKTLRRPAFAVRDAFPYRGPTGRVYCRPPNPGRCPGLRDGGPLGRGSLPENMALARCVIDSVKFGERWAVVFSEETWRWPRPKGP